jgi:MFS family permease
LRRFLAVGFLLFLSLGVVQAVVGFLFQDRLGLGATATAGAAGAAGFATGLVSVAVQGAVVPRLRWGPVRLLRVGTPIAVAGFLLLAVAPEFWSMTAGLMVVATGLGMATPGYIAGPTLLLGPAEQGAVAGLILATNGSTFVASPLLGSALYALGPAAPVLLGFLLCGVACALLVRPLRQAAPAPGLVLRNGHVDMEHLPPDDVREVLAMIWRNVLNRSPRSGGVDPGDNFFESGGDSVAAVALLTAIPQRLDVEVDPSTVLDALALGNFESLVRAVVEGGGSLGRRRI